MKTVAITPMFLSAIHQYLLTLRLKRVNHVGSLYR